jgi:hypothetical protein
MGEKTDEQKGYDCGSGIAENKKITFPAPNMYCVAYKVGQNAAENAPPRVRDIVKTVSRYRGRPAFPAINIFKAMFSRAPPRQSRNRTIPFRIA